MLWLSARRRTRGRESRSHRASFGWSASSRILERRLTTRKIQVDRLGSRSGEWGSAHDSIRFGMMTMIGAQLFRSKGLAVGWAALVEMSAATYAAKLDCHKSARYSLAHVDSYAVGNTVRCRHLDQGRQRPGDLPGAHSGAAPDPLRSADLPGWTPKVISVRWPTAPRTSRPCTRSSRQARSTPRPE